MDYYDEIKPVFKEYSLALKVTSDSRHLGFANMTGRIFNYTVEVSNRLINESIPNVIVVFSMPSCLSFVKLDTN